MADQLLLTAEPLAIQVGSFTVVGDDNTDTNQYVLTITWSWPVNYGTDWTRFRIVRSLNSPVVRVEEGVTLLETKPELYGDPVYQDQQPPPNHWCYYTMFVLNPQRIWVAVGTVYDIGVGGHEWSYKLPSLLPGVAVSADQGILSAPDAYFDLVQFLQGPALYFDRVSSLAESVQDFWDPLTVPPTMLGPMLDTLGFSLDETIGIARIRAIAAALLNRPSGVWDFIQPFVEAVTNGVSTVFQSNNLMLNTNDSSFESGTLGGSSWQPITHMSYSALPTLFHTYASISQQGGPPTPGVPPHATYADLLLNPTATISTAEVREYVDYPDPRPLLPPNVLRKYFLYVNGAVTMRAGAFDPIKYGVPVSMWDTARGGMYAWSPNNAQFQLALDLYDLYGQYLRQLVLVPWVTLTAGWTWYGTPFDKAIPVNRPGDTQDLLTELDSWEDAAFPNRNQLYRYEANPGGINWWDLYWSPSPNPGATAAYFGKLIPVLGQQLVHLQMTVQAPASSSQWRLSIYYDIVGTTVPRLNGMYSSGWIQPTGKSQTTTLEWVSPDLVGNVWVGIDVRRPPLVPTDYRRVWAENVAYSALPTAYPTYEDIPAWPDGGGWVGNNAVPNNYATVAAGFASGYNALAFSFANYGALTSYVPPVTYPDGPGVFTLQSFFTQVGTPDERLAWYAVPVIRTTDIASMDLLVVDDG